MRGKTPLSGDHLAAVRDARQRWLRPGGIAIPGHDDLLVAAVEAEGLAADLRLGWQPLVDLGFSADAARTSVLNSVHDDRRRQIPASAQLTTAATWATVVYGAEPEGVFGGSVKLESMRRGTAHGLAVWFETTLLDDIRYASAPGQELAYARCFLPFPEPVALTDGDGLEVSLKADARGTRWSWQTRVHDASGAEKASFRQASFLGMPTSPKALLRSSPSARPLLSSRGDRMRRILEAMDGTLTIDELVARATRDMSADDPRIALVAEEVRTAVRELSR
jgi:protein arginine N-methyltransferase 1